MTILDPQRWIKLLDQRWRLPLICNLGEWRIQWLARRLITFTGCLVLSSASLLLAGGGVAGATGYSVSDITVGPNSATVAVDSADHRLYAANQGSDTVSVVDTSTDLVVNTIVVGNAPRVSPLILQRISSS